MPERFTESELFPMLPAQADTCGLCFQWSDGYPLCHACKAIAETLGSTTIDAREIKVLPISLATEWEALATALYGYKNDADGHLREAYSSKVERLLHEYVAKHGQCLGAAAGGTKFDLITWIPSAQGARVGQRHPIADLLGRAPWTFDRITEVLSRTQKSVDKHRISSERFDVIRPVSGKTVLVVDDTWTTGSNAMSAVWSLRDAGATSVSVVVIGRWHNPNYRDYGTFSRHSKRVGFVMDACVYCDARPGLTIERPPQGPSPQQNHGNLGAAPGRRDGPPPF